MDYPVFTSGGEGILLDRLRLKISMENDTSLEEEDEFCTLLGI